jgi:hypothetical protein
MKLVAAGFRSRLFPFTNGILQGWSTDLRHNSVLDDTCSFPASFRLSCKRAQPSVVVLLPIGSRRVYSVLLSALLATLNTFPAKALRNLEVLSIFCLPGPHVGIA